MTCCSPQAKNGVAKTQILARHIILVLQSVNFLVARVIRSSASGNRAVWLGGYEEDMRGADVRTKIAYPPSTVDLARVVHANWSNQRMFRFAETTS